jgi:hypothetical protein
VLTSVVAPAGTALPISTPSAYSETSVAEGLTPLTEKVRAFAGEELLRLVMASKLDAPVSLAAVKTGADGGSDVTTLNALLPPM